MKRDEIVQALRAKFSGPLEWLEPVLVAFDAEIRALGPDKLETFLMRLGPILKRVFDGPDAAERFDELGAAIQAVLVDDALRSAVFRAAVASQNRDAANRRRGLIGRKLCPLLEQAWDEDPLAFFVVSLPLAPRSGDIGEHALLEAHRRVFQGIGAWEKYAPIRSCEPRAMALKDVAIAFEPAYKDFVVRLCRLDRFLRTGSLPKTEPDFGNAVSDASSAFPSLVDQDAARIRNAAAHGHWRFLPGNNAVRLRNYARGRLRWQQDFEVTELGHRLHDMIQAAAGAQRLLHAHSVYTFIFRSGLISKVELLAASYAKGQLKDPTVRFQDLTEELLTPKESALLHSISNGTSVAGLPSFDAKGDQSPQIPDVS